MNFLELVIVHGGGVLGFGLGGVEWRDLIGGVGENEVRGFLER